MTDPTERALELAAKACPCAYTSVCDEETKRTHNYCWPCSLRPAVARVIQGVMDERDAAIARQNQLLLSYQKAEAQRDALKREVERLGEPALLAANKVLIAEFDMLKADYDKLRARDQRIRELAAATGEAQRFQLEARFETKLDCLLDAIEETP